MKKLLKKYCFFAYLSFFSTIALGLSAQTNPVAQTLPFVQDFSTLAASSTTYPAGFQGWSFATAPGSTFNTAASVSGDKVLVANSTAATTSGNVHNYNGKIGFLTTGSLDLTLVLAFVTTAKSGIEVSYQAATIRNFIDASNYRINEMALQYRTDATSAFTTLPDTAYQNNITNQNSGVVPQNPLNIKIILPSDCNNKPLVQIRWVSRQVSGTGARPSFAIDNVSVTYDSTPPVYVSGFPSVSNILLDSFDFSTQINETGVTYFVLLPSGSAKPSASQIKLGQDANGTVALQSGFLSVLDKNLTYTKTFAGLTGNTSYFVYSISEDDSGNVQSDSELQTVTTSNVPVPSVTTSLNTINLGIVAQNTSSNVLSYQLQASDLSDGVALTVTGSFSISKTASSGFQSTLSFLATDFDGAASQTVYVRFSPSVTGAFTGAITHQSAGASNKIINLSGLGINPFVQNFNDPAVFTNSGWTSYSVTGNTLKWATTSVRFNSSPNAVQMNGFSETGPSNDWLISPKLPLDSFSSFPVLSFFARKFFTGPGLKLKVSTDYTGTGDPTLATWTDLDGNFPTTTGTFIETQNINLGAYKTANTYLAWVYESTAGGTNNNAEWTIDDVNISNVGTFITANFNLNFGDVLPNTVSASQSFVFTAGGYGDITVTAPANYQVSLDNITFQNTIEVTTACALSGITIYVRFAPITKAISLSGAVTFTGTGLNQQLGMLTGSSLPRTETFDVVSYNLEFFGSDVIGSTGTEFGPVDDALQVDNVAKVMNKLDADVYVVQEVSDETRLDELIQKININGKIFDKVISTSWSYSFEAPDPQFPPQKLVVIYNTQTTKVNSTSVLFKDFYDGILAGTTTLPGYPTSASSFYSSGRLPYLVNIESNINGIKKVFNIIDIHARANSGNDITKYNQRKFDVEYLKNELDTSYPNENLMILGDYNDDVDTSVIAGNPSSYAAFVTDTNRYKALTYDISVAGASSYLSSGGFLDHIMISNELVAEYVPNSTAVYDPRADVSNYVNTTSDHGPVLARFEFNSPTLSVSKNNFSDFSVKTFPNPTAGLLEVTVNSKTQQEVGVKLYDVFGRMVISPINTESVPNRDFKIDMSQLPQGIYLLTFMSGNSIIRTEKIIKN